MSFSNHRRGSVVARRAAAGVAAGAMLVALAACASSPSATPTQSDGTTDSSGAIPANEGQVVFAGFGGTYQTVFQKDIIDPFTAATGIQVTYVAGTAASGLTQLQSTASSPTVDVYWGSGMTQPQGVSAGLFAPLDPSIVTQLSNVFDYARQPKDLGVVMGTYQTGLEYNVKAYKDNGLNPPTSWADLWSNPKVASHVALLAVDNGYTQVSLVQWAKALGGDENDMQPLWDKFGSTKFLTVADTAATQDSLLQQGEVWLTYNANSRVYQLNQTGGVEVAFVAPKEGAVQFDNTFDLVKNAQHPIAAQIFINYALQAEAQTAIAKDLQMSPTLKGLDLPADVVTSTGYSSNGKPSLPLVQPAVKATLANLESWSKEWQSALG